MYANKKKHEIFSLKNLGSRGPGLCSPLLH